MKSPYRRISLALGALFVMGCDPKPTTGAIIVNVAGLPAGGSADVRVTGPNDFDESVASTTTFEDLPPGDYTVSINAVTHANGYFTSPTSQRAVTVTAGHTETADVTYALSGGSLDVAISGLPAGIPPQVRLSGPGGFSRMVLTSGVQAGLPAGVYTLRADTLSAADGERYGTSAFQQTVTVPASQTPVPANVAYTVVSGTLNVVVEGLPESTNTSPVTVTGPAGFQRTTAFSVTYRGLTAGTYTITAANVGSCPSVYAPSQPTQSVAVPSGSAVTSTVSYSPSSANSAELNLRIDGAYLVQVAQNYSGTVPMIAGRKALLRVFGSANQCNTATPKVRVTLSNGTVYDNLSLGEGEASTRLTPEQGFLAASYNVELPASAVVPGLSFFAEIDPGNQYAEANESDNRYPASGSRTVDVRMMAPTGLRFVPIHFSANNTTGTIDPSLAAEFMNLSQRVLPVHSFDVDYAAPFTTTKPALQANNQNGSWGQVLQELLAKQQTEATGRYYYGVVKVSYTSGVAGIGYIGNKAALGWDYLPSGSEIMAHELGHNFSMQHTPCGNPGGVDAAYPTTGTYAGGYIGTYGFDFTDNSVKHPQSFTDVMGYCRTQWISDFSYGKMLSWLAPAGRSLPSIVSAAEEPGLLVWGRIVNGQPVLEPAFEVTARTQIPSQGANRLTGLDADGRAVFSVSFDAQQIADLAGEEAFAMVLPKRMLRGATLASLRLTTASGRTATNVQSAVTAPTGVTLARTGPRAMRLRWDAARHPVVMVRDARTGEVLSFARGGDAAIVAPADEVELNYSNRVRSIRELRRPR